MSEEDRKKKRTKKRRLIIASVLVVVTVLSFWANPVASADDRRLAEAVRYSKSIGYALFNFENDFGSYPNERSRATLLEESDEGERPDLGSSFSNDYLRQLIVAGYIDSDAIFDGGKMGRNVAPSMKLGPGTCWFAYVVWEKKPPMTGPLLIGPVKPGTRKISKNAVVLRRDMPVADPSSDDAFFDWSHPQWGGQKPKIVWPE